MRASYSAQPRNSLRRRDHRSNKFFRTHLDGTRIRQPCNNRFRRMMKNNNFASCFNACTSSNRQQSKESSFPVVWDSTPKCAACAFAKQKVRSSPGRKIIKVSDVEGNFKKNNLFPGQEVSVDHFVCSTKGRLFKSRGKTAEENMYGGGCLFIDHSSNYVNGQFQTTWYGHATITSKESFETHARDIMGVVVQNYLSDNGTSFTSLAFHEHLRSRNQNIRFAGVGAHHHNGHAERAIGTVMSITRAILIHATLHWPALSDVQLWPMCIPHACYLWNHVPSPSTGLSPSDLFTRSQ